MALHGPYATYTIPTEVISAAAQVQVVAAINALLDLIPIGGTAPGKAVTPSPIFDELPPAAADQLRTEIIALRTAIDAAPTA